MGEYGWRSRRRRLTTVGAVVLLAACSEPPQEPEPRGGASGASQSAHSPAQAAGGEPLRELERLHEELNTTDLALTVVAAPDPVEAGNALTYTVTVENRGPNPSSSTHLVLAPLGGVLLRIDDDCARDDRSVSWSCELGELAARQRRDIELTVVVDEDNETLRLTARVSNRFGPDLREEDNSWTETTRIASETR